CRTWCESLKTAPRAADIAADTLYSSTIKAAAARPAAFRGVVMDATAFLVMLIVGAVAGWLAGQIVRGMGFGLIGNIVVGIVGALIAGWLLPQIGIVIGGGIIAAIINATIGAVVLLFIVGLIKRA